MWIKPATTPGRSGRAMCSLPEDCLRLVVAFLPTCAAGRFGAVCRDTHEHTAAALRGRRLAHGLDDAMKEDVLEEWPCATARFLLEAATPPAEPVELEPECLEHMLGCVVHIARRSLALSRPLLCHGQIERVVELAAACGAFAGAYEAPLAAVEQSAEQMAQHEHEWRENIIKTAANAMEWNEESTHAMGLPDSEASEEIVVECVPGRDGIFAEAFMNAYHGRRYV